MDVLGAVANLIARLLLGLLRVRIDQAEKPQSVVVDEPTDEERQEASAFDRLDVGLFVAGLLSLWALSGCAKPREYVLSREKVYVLARPATVAVVVNDPDHGPVVYEHTFQPGSKIKRP